MKRYKKTFRASLESTCCLFGFMIGLGAALWMCFGVVDNSITEEPRLWPSLFGLSAYFLLSVYGMKRQIQVKVVLEADKIIFRNGKIRKEAKYEEIEKVHYKEMGGFDAGSAYFLFLVFPHRLSEIDKDSYSDAVSWFKNINPEKTITLGLSLFDQKTIARILLCLSQLSPEKEIIVGAWSEWQIKRWQSDLAKIGGIIEPLQTKGEWKVKPIPSNVPASSP